MRFSIFTGSAPAFTAAILMLFVTEDELQRAFVLAFNQILCDKSSYIYAYEPIIAALTDTTREDSQIAELQQQCSELYTKLEALVGDNAHRAQSQEAYREKCGALATQYENAKERLVGVESEKQAKLLRRQENTMLS